MLKAAVRSSILVGRKDVIPPNSCPYMEGPTVNGVCVLVTGRRVAPPLFDTMAAIDRDR